MSERGIKMQTTNNLLGITRDGCKVYDREDNPVYQEGITKNLLREALSYMYMNKETFKIKEIFSEGLLASTGS